MTDIGPNNPGTAVSDASPPTAQVWNNPDNIKISDNTYASSVSSTFGSTRYLKATNFGFSIPADAIIKGVSVGIEHGHIGPFAADWAVQIIKSDGTLGDTNKAKGTVWSSGVDETYSYGGNDDLWDEVWTAADINNANFGVVLQAYMYNTTALVDNIHITVHYTPVSSSPLPTFLP